MPDDMCRKILNAVKNNLQHYVGRMSSEDLKRDSKSALFGAIDHVRCARVLCVCALYVLFFLALAFFQKPSTRGHKAVVQ